MESGEGYVATRRRRRTWHGRPELQPGNLFAGNAVCGMRDPKAGSSAKAFAMIHKLAAIAPTVLVVDCEPMAREAVCEFLADRGIPGALAENATEALAFLQRESGIKVVFTEIRITGEADGLDLAKEIKRRWPEIHLLVTTGRGGFSRSDLPADGHFVAKPYDFDVVATTIERLLVEKATSRR